jgi:hypothetical protein
MFRAVSKTGLFRGPFPSWKGTFFFGSCSELVRPRAVDDSPHLQPGGPKWLGDKCPASNRRTFVRREHL